MSKTARKQVKKPARKPAPAARKPVAKRGGIEGRQGQADQAVSEVEPRATAAASGRQEPCQRWRTLSRRRRSRTSRVRTAPPPACRQTRQIRRAPAAKSAPAAVGALPAVKPADAKAAAPQPTRKIRQGRRSSRRREARDPAAAEHARRPPVAAQAADCARQGTKLPDLRRGQRPPAVRDRRSGADRRHRADDQRHGHPGVREGTGRRVAADARAGRCRRRSRRGSRAALATTVDAEFGRTTDPVRMYMREMGTVELLTREGEIAIAKRIEEGLDSVREALSHYPPTYDLLLRTYEPVKDGQGRLIDIIVGFVDPNAPDVIAEPINPKLAAEGRARGRSRRRRGRQRRGRRGPRDRPRSGRGRAALRVDRTSCTRTS